MRHFASSSFWEAYSKLPNEIRNLADKKFSLLKDNPRHRSLQFKAIRQFRSARVGAHYRALGVETGGDVLWFWIGSHADYDTMIG